jgi:hypothetical protein
VTTPGITAALGISGVRLNQLAREGRIPRGAKRWEWDLDAVRQAIARNIDVIHKERQAASTAARMPVRPPPVFDQVPPPLTDVPRGSLSYSLWQRNGCGTRGRMRPDEVAH